MLFPGRGEMLGVDPGEFAQFKRWSDARSQIFNTARIPEQSAELAAPRQSLDDYFARAVDERRRQRGKDLVSALVSAEESEDRLSQREIVITCDLLLIADNLTTTDLSETAFWRCSLILISSPNSAPVPNSCPMRSRRYYATTHPWCRPRR
jgi:cytochrome P450